MGSGLQYFFLPHAVVVYFIGGLGENLRIIFRLSLNWLGKFGSGGKILKGAHSPLAG